VVFGIVRGYVMKSGLETSTYIDYIVSVMVRQLVGSFVAERRASGRRNARGAGQLPSGNGLFEIVRTQIGGNAVL
jgi:hypothetical protein